MTTETVFTKDMTYATDPIRSSECLSLVLSGVAANEDEARSIIQRGRERASLAADSKRKAEAARERTTADRHGVVS